MPGLTVPDAHTDNKRFLCYLYMSESLSSVLRPHQHSIGYTGDGFYRSKDLTNSIKVLYIVSTQRG